MKHLVLFTLCLFATQIYSQELETEVFDLPNEQIQNIDSLEVYKVKRLSLGIKLGIPNIAGISLEGITPIFENRIAPFFDYSSFPVQMKPTLISNTLNLGLIFILVIKAREYILELVLEP
ncbi:MAG: hypothetical protein ACPHVX_06895 [Flavobacteriaceae bacterium]